MLSKFCVSDKDLNFNPSLQPIPRTASFQDEDRTYTYISPVDSKDTEAGYVALTRPEYKVCLRSQEINAPHIITYQPLALDARIEYTRYI